MTAVEERIPTITELVEDPSDVRDRSCDICAESKPFGCPYRGRTTGGDVTWLRVCEACARWVLSDTPHTTETFSNADGGGGA